MCPLKYPKQFLVTWVVSTYIYHMRNLVHFKVTKSNPLYVNTNNIFT